MKKSEIIDKISTREGVSKKDTQIIIESFLQIIAETLANKEEVKLNCFGTFYVGKRKARTTTDVSSKNKVIEVPESYDVRFKAGKPLKSIIKDGDID